MLSYVSDKANLFAKNFPKNSNLEYPGISLRAFPSRTNLKLHSISVTPTMIKNVNINLDLLKESGPDCIQVMVLKYCESEFLYILVCVWKNIVFQVL